ncbi:MAG: hypothetical protein R3B70_09455 [Polyangiaceae bacterium]
MSANRRTVLLSGLATLLVPWSSGCGPGPGPVTPPSPPLPALHTSPLADLVAAGGLRWILLAAPRELLSVPWIPPLVDLAVSGARFDRFAKVTGIDLRAIPEAIVTSTTSKSDDEVLFYLARHTGDPAFIERSFRARLTSEEKRSVDRPDLIRVSGKVGRAPNAAVFIGPDIAGFQEAGSMSRGPARVAALFAEQKLKSAHTALAVDPIRSLAAKLGPAPRSAFAPGPFEGDLARGLRGLLGAATGIGGVLRPSVRQGFFVTLAVSGDFATSSGPAGSELMAAWNDLAQSRLGHVLGLDAPLTAPSIALAPDAVGLSVELSGRALADGLARLTATRVEDIFR